MMVIAPSNWALMWRSLRTGFLIGAVLELLLLLARAAGLLSPIPGLILLSVWLVQANFIYATQRDRSDGYRGGAAAALLLASLFGLLAALGVSRAGGSAAWGWFAFAFSVALNWGAAVERRMSDRRAARPRVSRPPGWRRVPWYSWIFLPCALFMLFTAGSQMMRDLRLERDGVTTKGAVTDRSVSSGKYGASYMARYRFRSADGIEREGRAALPLEAWEKTKTEPTLDIRYVASAPDESRPVASGPEGPWWFLLLSILSAATAVLLVTASWRGWIQED
jgi:hypothetical protein